MASKVSDKTIRYYNVKNYPNVTHLKAEIYYSLGGINYFTYKNESRGYYMSISPVKREVTDSGYTMESYTAFSGLKQCVLPVQRKSQKKMNEAIEYFDKHILEFMNNHFSEFDVDTENYEVR